MCEERLHKRFDDPEYGIDSKNTMPRDTLSISFKGGSAEQLKAFCSIYLDVGYSVVELNSSLLKEFIWAYSCRPV